jgi:hypothetical protein
MLGGLDTLIFASNLPENLKESGVRARGLINAGSSAKEPRILGTKKTWKVSTPSQGDLP